MRASPASRARCRDEGREAAQNMAVAARGAHCTARDHGPGRRVGDGVFAVGRLLGVSQPHDPLIENQAVTNGAHQLRSSPRGPAQTAAAYGLTLAVPIAPLLQGPGLLRINR